jgi:hypothetical protein
MEWTEKELKEIRLIVSYMNCALLVAANKNLRLDIEHEQVHITYRNGTIIKRIPVGGDSACGVFHDVVKALAKGDIA